MPGLPTQIYPFTLKYIPSRAFIDCQDEDLPGRFKEFVRNENLPAFLPDLACVEKELFLLKNSPITLSPETDIPAINPTLEIIGVEWSGLVDILQGRNPIPVPGKQHILIYRHPLENTLRVMEASGHDLLAMKIVAEGLDRREVAEATGANVEEIDAILRSGVLKGLIQLPASTIKRTISSSASIRFQEDRVETFTLQWHITQKCDLHCRHCYDRSARSDVSLLDATKILNQFYDFCQENHVTGQVSFTGGNPFLHPYFKEIYGKAVDRGFLTAILANPVDEQRLEKIVQISRPEYFQVSLEGLQHHNDYIRGTGHFNRTIAFLEILKKQKVYTLVMLTLTRANHDQVLELAELLRDKVDGFNFNRLATVGEGASLNVLPTDDYETFLRQYLKAAEDNPVMGLKDNLFNILMERDGQALTGGCTGFGCGAAFNFVSLLPDGEVHACRKFPSQIGSLKSSTLLEVYNSDAAEQYRAGSTACIGCDLRHRCRGCPAVAFDGEQDVLKILDPYCFRK